mmetsp:Transcript_94658/g.276752  ORF Transcript_94658/g.276752 Transcript_94658/m.276752 type:complete len:81 (+) Transcript_94658:24-266(+)
MRSHQRIERQRMLGRKLPNLIVGLYRHYHGTPFSSNETMACARHILSSNAEMCVCQAWSKREQKLKLLGIGGNSDSDIIQ